VARIVSFTTPLMDSTGLVRFPWRGPGDALPLEMEVALDELGDASIEDVRAEVWTNANQTASPERFNAVAMKLVEHTPWRARFALELPVRRVGNYRAVGRVSVDGGPFTWMSESNIDDIRFRPRDLRSRGLLIEEVSVAHVNWDPFEKACGTFADMMDGSAGMYTLRALAERGVDAVWIMPPFDVHLWEHRHALDELGSPYPVRDYFTVRPDLSRAARVSLLTGGDDDEARDAGLDEVRAFIAAARDLNIRVLLDVALNHVGHEHRFRDRFDVEVRADLSQVTREAQRALVPRKLDDAGSGLVIDHSAPWMYANRHGDPAGAAHVDDKVAGGYGEWPDTVQLNHGRVREAYRVWRDITPPLPVHKAVQSWLERVLLFWAVDMGVDGFRLDHLSGLPYAFLEGALNRVQAAVDAKEPGRTLFIVGEDFHTSNETRHFVDAIQGGFFRDLLQVRTPAAFAHVIDEPWFNDVLALSTHDEPRPLVVLGDDARAYARLQSLLLLAGGPASLVAGDHLGERVPLPFKRARGIEALRAPSRDGRAIAEQLARVGRARKERAALRTEARAWLHPLDGSDFDDAIVAFVRSAESDERVFVVANFSNDSVRTRAFAFTAARGTTQLHDVLTREPAPCALVDGALMVTLEPYEVRVLVGTGSR
jgi:glycosidase